LRGALFGVVEKGSRKYEKNVLKATVNSLSDKFTGEQLDQADLDVWIECLRLNQKLLPFFQSQFWTGLSVEHRGKLKSKSLTLWLHSFYSTHSKPYDYKVEKLMFLCGSKVALMWKFRQMLKKSLTDLSKVTGWKCLIDENDLVQVKKN